MISHGKPCPLGGVDGEMFWGTGVGNEVCGEEMWMEYKMKLREKIQKWKCPKVVQGDMFLYKEVRKCIKQILKFKW